MPFAFNSRVMPGSWKPPVTMTAVTACVRSKKCRGDVRRHRVVARLGFHVKFFERGEIKNSRALWRMGG